MDNDLGLSNDLVIYANRLIRSLRRRHDVPAHGRVLSILDELGPQGVTALAIADRCSQPTMSAAVAQLVESGLVSKEPNPVDARGSVVALTDEGRAELQAYRSTYAATVAERLEASGHTTEELATAVALLKDLLEVSSEEGST